LFYMANALILPVRGLVRRAQGEAVAWCRILPQAGLALGILLGIWIAGWALGFWLRAVELSPIHGALPSAGVHAARLLGAATILVSFVTLGAVLLSVQVARVALRRRV
jgi:hypothetical protein